MRFFYNNLLGLIISFIFCIISFISLGEHALLNYDEAIYARVAIESLASPLDLKYFGNPWHEKPPLFIWMTQLSVITVGSTELGIRFFIPVFAGGTIFITYLLVKEVHKEEGPAALSASAFFICYQFILNSFFLDIDITLTFFIALALFSYLKTKNNKKYWYLFWLATGLAFMTKSVLGLFPIVFIFSDLLINERGFLFREKYFKGGIIIFLFTIIPWHLHQTILYGKTFWNSYFLYHVIKRGFTVLENNGGGYWFYLDIFKENNILLLLTSISILVCIYKLKQRWFRFLFLNLLFVFVFFSLSKTKGYSYITIIYPLLTSIIGLSLYEIFKTAKKTKLVLFSWCIACVTFIYTGLSYNEYKIYKWTKEAYLEDNKKIAAFLRNRNESIYSGPSSKAGPSVWFYYGEKIPTVYHVLTHGTPIFHTQTKNIYKTVAGLIIN